ncbi:MAG: D-arabinono-1,4-lactone oxidase [Microbacterium sp.]
MTIRVKRGVVRNWSGAASARPESVVYARTVEDVVDAVRQAAARGLPVKAIGAGHSFTPIALTDGVLVDVSGLEGVLVYDPDTLRVTLAAGTNLWQLPELIRPLGLALENMGDIDRQTIAGATSSGTHGTGIGLGGLATQIRSVTLVTASGEVLTIGENDPRFGAARLGLGALGILVAIELQCVKAFLLHAVERGEPFDVIDELLPRAREHDHVEAYWWPHTDRLSTKTNDRLPSDAPYQPLGRAAAWVEDELLGNGAHIAICTLGLVAPALTPSLNRLAASLYGNRSFTGESYDVFTSPRRVRFREMEYSIPAEALPAAIREIRTMIDRSGWRISFPVELRFAAADDVWLSTAYGRESAYIAVHRYHREAPWPYFRAVERILRAYEGRPHWGKVHTRTREDLEPVYPKLAAFAAVRDELDPDRVFQNAYTRRILGP